jgi:hypothetical protein
MSEGMHQASMCTTLVRLRMASEFLLVLMVQISVVHVTSYKWSTTECRQSRGNEWCKIRLTYRSFIYQNYHWSYSTSANSACFNCWRSSTDMIQELVRT